MQQPSRRPVRRVFQGGRAPLTRVAGASPSVRVPRLAIGAPHVMTFDAADMFRRLKKHDALYPPGDPRAATCRACSRPRVRLGAVLVCRECDDLANWPERKT